MTNQVYTHPENSPISFRFSRKAVFNDFYSNYFKNNFDVFGVGKTRATDFNQSEAVVIFPALATEVAWRAMFPP